MSKMFVDQDVIRELATLLNETDLTEIEVEDGDKKIRVARNVTASVSTTVAAPAPAAISLAPVPTVAESIVADKNHPGAITSPMVGTAYTSPDPESAAFVSVGDKVSAGQTILIIEAMKVMNQIPAPKGGTVTKILVENSQPVEYGEVLVIIE